MESTEKNKSASDPLNWTIDDVKLWLERDKFSKNTISLLCEKHELNGKSLLLLSDPDFLVEPLISLPLRERKELSNNVVQLQRVHRPSLIDAGLLVDNCAHRNSQQFPSIINPYYRDVPYAYHNNNGNSNYKYNESEHSDDQSLCFPSEIGKAILSFVYMASVTWVTAFVMVIVHDRVPDMQKYPPLPDIVLDNIPYISWAFNMCEIIGTILFIMWSLVLFFHKHRFILIRRFFALSGTIFFLRCITMIITSLSVPGSHLECKPRSFNTDNIYVEIVKKFSQAYVIWRGAGMSIHGVRTCGDYMFSGHTVALTMLNFFITEYTPTNWHILHTLTWLLNMFGIFFILAGHEHYSIDVFIAFYITSRLFLYYHTLSNNRALMQRDAHRRRMWFPLFSYFENSVDGIVPNEFDSICTISYQIYQFLIDTCFKFNSVFYSRYTKLLDEQKKKVS